jgi:rRNA small subunit pseudouridine methyltransferase Nep1
VLTLILAESELELVPEELKSHPSVRAAARRRDKRPVRTLLDASVHHDALSDYPDGERRGRPDLTHFFLLLGLDSVLNRTGNLRLLVHTRNDELIRVDPATRIMRNYNRFTGLMEQLFRNHVVPSERTPLLRLEEGWTLKHVLEKEAAGAHVTVLKEGGSPVAPAKWAAERAAAGGDACVVIGGFPKGDYRSDVTAFADATVSFHEDPLSVWTVAMEVIAHWEAVAGVFERA